MLKVSRRYLVSAALARVESLIAAKEVAQISKAICALKTTDLDSNEWNSLTDSVIQFAKSNKQSAAVIPAVVIATASTGNSISESQKTSIGNLISESFESLSKFDKAVLTIGCSQSGFRTPAVVDFVNRFLTEARETQFENMPVRLMPSLLLAVATLGIDNQLSWNHLVASIDFENLNQRDLVNVALAIVTSRTFPIATVERIVASSLALGGESFAIDDAVCLAHSLTCLEVFQADLFRSLLFNISKAESLDDDAKRLTKQVLLSLFLDEKAHAITEAISPVVLAKLDTFIDWSAAETQRHHGRTAGEIQQIFGELEQTEDADNSVTRKPASLKPLADWTRDTAVSVAMDRFYVSDVPVNDSKRLFIHIDDETYPDVSDGPLDPFLQLKHAHVQKCGYRVMWVREQDWMDSEWEEKVEYVKSYSK
jgi:hypothetical protein